MAADCHFPNGKLWTTKKPQICDTEGWPNLLSVLASFLCREFRTSRQCMVSTALVFNTQRHSEIFMVVGRVKPPRESTDDMK